MSGGKAGSRDGFRRNTAAKDVRIKAGIKTDPDAGELTAKDFAEMVPFAEMMKRRRGRPKTATHKGIRDCVPRAAAPARGGKPA